MKTGSILDYQRSDLCPDIWTPAHVLKKGIKKFILSSIDGFFEEHDIQGYTEFVVDILVGSALATYFYKEDSDLDIKIVIDIPTFQKNNPNFEGQTEDDILLALKKLGRSSMWLTTIIPGTSHPIDAYFISNREATEENLVKYDSLYSFILDDWIKYPKKLQEDLSPSYILNYAKDIAKRYLDKISLDIEQVKRDSIDFIMLHDYMKTLDKADLKQLYVDFNTALDKINKSVEDVVQDKEIIKNLRKKVFSDKELNNDFEKIMGSINFSDENLIFKIIQRYGYMRILSEISRLYNDDQEITPDEVNDILEIV